MVKFIKFISYTVFFVFMLIVFLPKENLYYFLKKELHQYNITLKEEHIDEGVFSLSLDKLEINYEGMDVAEILKLETECYLFLNIVTVENIQLSSLVESYIPREIQHMRVEYSILHPLSIRFEADGKFGDVAGEFSLMERAFVVRVKLKKMMEQKYKKSLRYLKKLKTGEYIYEKAL